MNDFSNNESISRREMLRRSAAGFGNLALLSLLAESGFAQVKPDPLAPKRPLGRAGPIQDPPAPGPTPRWSGDAILVLGASGLLVRV